VPNWHLHLGEVRASESWCKRSHCSSIRNPVTAKGRLRPHRWFGLSASYFLQHFDTDGPMTRTTSDPHCTKTCFTNFQRRRIRLGFVLSIVLACWKCCLGNDRDQPFVSATLHFYSAFHSMPFYCMIVLWRQMRNKD